MSLYPPRTILAKVVVPGGLAIAFILCAGLVASWQGSLAVAQQVQPAPVDPEVVPAPVLPEYDRNALFITDDGKAQYLAANLAVFNWMGLTLIGADFVDCEWNIGRVAFIFTNDPTKLIFISDFGPIGTVTLIAGAEPPLRWEDASGNAGFIITF